MFNGTQGKKTWAIISANILMASIIKKYTRDIYMKLICHASYHEHQRQVFCEGVLKIYPVDVSDPLRSHAYLSYARYEYQSGT